MKKAQVFDRPLIPFFILLSGGILTAHFFSPFFLSQKLLLFLLLSASLGAFLFSSGNLKIFMLLAAFYLTGLILPPGSPPPSRLQSLAQNHGKATLEGVVFEPIHHPEAENARMTVQVHALFRNHQAVSLNEKIRVTVYRHVPTLFAGERIRFPGRLSMFKNFQNPGYYDYEKAMALKGFTCAASVGDGRRIVPMGPGRLPFFVKWRERIQRPVRFFLKNHLSKENEALYRALILGERQGIEPALRESFNRSGLGHLLTVSGLHIGLVAWAVFAFLKWFFLRFSLLTLLWDVRKWSAFLTCFAVVGYTVLAGFHISAQRAMIMILAYLVSLMLGREKEIWSTLSLAGLIILFLDPDALFRASFQLSFTAVTGILWLTPPILKKLGTAREQEAKPGGIIRTILYYFTGLAAVSTAAFIFMLPLTAYYFHRIPLVSIPANLTTVPLLGLWILPLSLLSVTALPLWPSLASVLLQASAWGLDLMMVLVRFWANLSWSGFWVVTPNLFEMALFYGFTGCAAFGIKRPWARAGLAVVTALFVMDVAYWVHRVHFNDHLEVVYLDVGKGNAALICFPDGKKMMIDGGGFSGGTFNVGKMVVAPFLWRLKIGRIDYLVLSHPQADHMNGLRFIAEAFGPREFWYNGDQVETATFRELMEILDEKGISLKRPEDLQDIMSVNGVVVEVLHPEPGDSPVDSESDGKMLNNRSLVVKISNSGTSFLFPGDLEADGEAALVSNAGSRLKSQVLLAPHHGSNTSSTESFLKKVQPRLCIVSSGEDHTGHFPHLEVLNRLERLGCTVLQIARTGAVTVRVHSKGFEAQPFIFDSLSKHTSSAGSKDALKFSQNN